jgi:hypothetical protein
MVDPYAQANPYSLPPVSQRPYVSAQSSVLPAVPMQQVHQAHNSAAIAPVVVGAIAFLLSIVGFIPGSPVFYYSAGGIIAVIGGIRVLVRHGRGFGTVVWAPVLAIVLGGLAVIFMITGIIIHETASTYYSGSTSQVGTGASGSNVSSTAVLPVAPTFDADLNLTTYEQSAAVIAQSIDTDYNGGYAASAAPNWPAALNETNDGQVTFPSGAVAATLPGGEVVKYVVSSDGKYFDLSVSGGDYSEVAVYDSQSNTFTWACETGAPGTCPAGGIPPSSGGSSTGANT